MENMSYFAMLLSTFIFIFLVSKLGTQSMNKHKSFNLPPGPRKFPIIGNLHLLLGSRPPHHILRDLAKKYGPLMHLQLGEISTIVVSSSEFAKQVLKTHDASFAFRPSLLATEIICYGNTGVAFAPYGEYWRRVRRISTVELLSLKRIQSFRPIREKEILNLCKWIASKEGSPINLAEKIRLTTYDIVTLSSLGKKTNEQAKFISIFQETLKYLVGFDTSDVFPSVKILRWISGLKRKIERLHKESDRILENIILDHKLATSLETVGIEPKHEDLLDVLLRYHEDAGLEEKPLTMDDIKAVIQDLFSGGSETSTTIIDWAMSEMLKNPEVLKKAQEEVRRVFDGISRVDESHFDELKYLKLVIKETLRMHPPVPLLLPRECNEHCEINGYDIPIKTRVLVNVWAICKDPEIWEEAEIFKPERFLNNSIDYKGNDFEYIPFGGGRRICPGIWFGLANVELPLTMLLYHFDWLLDGGRRPEELDMAETIGLTSRRKNDLHAIPIVSRPLPIE